MKQSVLKTILLALPLTMATMATVATASPPADEAAAEVTEEEALDDDILMVIDLPIAADEARDAGLEEEEIDEALDAAEEAAVSPAVITEALDDEAPGERIIRQFMYPFEEFGLDGHPAFTFVLSANRRA